MDGIADGLQLFVKKRDVGKIYKVQVKESSEDEWKDLNTEIRDVRDVYTFKFEGGFKKQYDFRVLTSRISPNDQQSYLLFESKEQFVYGMYYH